MKKRLIALIGATMLLGSIIGIAAPIVSATTESIDTCVTIYEDSGGTFSNNDSATFCNTSPTLVKKSNFSGFTTGLHSGCNAIFGGRSPDWNDCVTSFSYGNLPASYKVVFYGNGNYVSQIDCFDANGNWNDHELTGTANDNASSFRILTGNC